MEKKYKQVRLKDFYDKKQIFYRGIEKTIDNIDKIKTSIILLILGSTCKIIPRTTAIVFLVYGTYFLKRLKTEYNKSKLEVDKDIYNDLIKLKKHNENIKNNIDSIMIYNLDVEFNKLQNIKLRLKKSSDYINELKLIQINILEDIKEFKKTYLIFENKYIIYNERNRIIKTYKNVKKCIKSIPNYLLVADQEINDFLKLNIQKYLKNYNQNFIENELIKNKHMFNSINGKSLDEDQRLAVVMGEQNTLVIAGAGSGKTLTISAKYNYLINKGVNVEDILLLSFTRKSANEMKGRIEKLIHKDIQSFTFHSLGLDIIKEKYGEKPNIVDEQNQIINKYFNEIILEDEIKSNEIMDFLAFNFNIIDDLSEINHIGEIYEKYRPKDYETIKSKVENKRDELKKEKISLRREYLKSKEEVLIANFLYLNGVKYKYEINYPHKYIDENGYKGVYNPDFYLVDYDIYLEHFGITSDYKCPWLDDIEEKRYIESIKWKRKFHKEHGTKLIETYSYMQSRGTLINDLEIILKQNSVKLNKLDYREVYKDVFIDRKDDYLIEFKKTVNTFINLFKSKGYDIKDFAILKDNKINDRNLKFLEIIEDVFIYYEEQLEKYDAIDFNDMINMATDIVKNNKVNRNYKYIIIDEYQDISYSRFNLIKNIVKKCNAKIMAVGDDWQSIYRFTGSDIDLFINFKDYFGYTESIKIKNVYRNPKEVLELSSNFILENSSQISKKLVANNKKPGDIEIYMYKNNFIDIFKYVIDKIVKNEGELTDILILGRNNFDKNIIMNGDINNDFIIIEENNEVKIEYYKYKRLKIKFLTVHGSKGLEANNVIMINMNDSQVGFPNKISDDPILKLVLIGNNNFEYEEERRLFYVGMTRTKGNLYMLSESNKKSIFIKELIEKHNINSKEIEVVEDSESNGRLNIINSKKIIKCNNCKTGELILKKNKRGKEFLACSNFPACKKTYNDLSIIENPIICSKCGDYMVKRNGKYGDFYGCSNYPKCKNTMN